MSDEFLIDVQGLHAGYGGIPVLRDITLNVRPGEVVALLGPNGAGKTTTLLTISGLLAPLEGSVTVLGEPVTGHKAYNVARRGLAHVPEDRSLFFDLTVDENIRLGLEGKPRRAQGSARPGDGAAPGAQAARPPPRRASVRRRAADAGDGAARWCRRPSASSSTR